MKQQEERICVTYVIMFILVLIINEICYDFSSIIDMALCGLAWAMLFLLFLWLATRRYKILALLALFSIYNFLAFYYYSSRFLLGWLVYFIIATLAAYYQGSKLLEEVEDFEDEDANNEKFENAEADTKNEKDKKDVENFNNGEFEDAQADINNEKDEKGEKNDEKQITPQCKNAEIE